jgi:hypothetical protein
MGAAPRRLKAQSQAESVPSFGGGPGSRSADVRAATADQLPIFRAIIVNARSQMASLPAIA